MTKQPDDEVFLEVHKLVEVTVTPKQLVYQSMSALDEIMRSDKAPEFVRLMQKWLAVR